MLKKRRVFADKVVLYHAPAGPQMKRTCFILIATAVLTQQPLHAHKLCWSIPDNYRIEIVRTARVNYLINGKTFNTYDERNIIDLTCAGHVGDKISVKGVFSVYERPENEKVFNLRRQYQSQFAISPQGVFIVPDSYLMPNLRNIPLFPDEDIAAGNTWQGNGELVLNNFSRPFKLVFPVRYALRKGPAAGSGSGIIDFEYEVDMDLRRGSYPTDFPIRIVGASRGNVTWDLEKNAPLRGDEEYRMVFMLGAIHSGVALHEYRMNIATEYKLYPPVGTDEKRQQKEELKKAIPEDRDIDIDSNERGIVLRLGEVFFDFDSAALKAEAKKNLDLVADVIRRKYPDREIIVEGHTDTTGQRDYNFGPSKNRARSVAEYLRPGMGSDKLSYRGLGPDVPLADNATVLGRQKNRRVEIIIKLK